MKVNMNTQLNKESLQNLYYEYKEYLIPIVSIIISIFLLLVFLIPQLSSFSEKNKQRDTEMTKLSQLKKATDIASVTDLNKLDSDLALASSALPANKDFGRILDALSRSASNSNVTIIDYQFQDKTSLVGSPKKFLGLSFLIDIAATPAQTIDFVNKLYNSLPLSEVFSISSAGGVSFVSVVFYYKSFTPVGSEEKITIRKMNNLEFQTLNIISQWDSLTTGSGDASISSPSAETSSPL